MLQSLFFGKRRSTLKWDPDAWRKYPEKSGNELFLAEIALLRAPPKNLNPITYIACIEQGLRRLHWNACDQLEATDEKFWEIINSKPYTAFKKDAVSDVAKALRTIPHSYSFFGAVEWADRVCTKLRQVQADRPLRAFPDAIGLWSSYLLSWDKYNTHRIPYPDMSKAPTWAQQSSMFLQNIKLAPDASKAHPIAGLVTQLGEELPLIAISIAKELFRFESIKTNPVAHEGAIQILEKVSPIVISQLPEKEAAVALFSLADKVFEPLSASGERIVQCLIPLVNQETQNKNEPFVMWFLSSYWDCESIHRIWSHFPRDIRETQAEALLNYFCRLKEYSAQDGKVMLLGMDDPIWEYVVKEIYTMRPWSASNLDLFSNSMPNTRMGCQIAKALDPQVEIICTLDERSWLTTWRQSLEQTDIFNSNESEGIAGDVFQSDGY